jgi:methyltransferase (TIGR00027 family)
MSARIENVSDTALWVAHFRAVESQRPDRLFNDPYAALLTGARGEEIARHMPAADIMAWLMAVRTVAIDRLIEHALALRVDTVINLGAGLDSRPYRMDLPAHLHWIEIDFPTMIAYKTERLKAAKPRCRLTRLEADLSQTEARQQALQTAAQNGQKILIITEGVIHYLSNDQTKALAQDLYQIPAVQYWIQDYTHGGLRRRRPRSWTKALKSAPLLFAVDNWFEFFQPLGWQVQEKLVAFDEAHRLRRPFPFRWWMRPLYYLLPKARREDLRNASGYALFTKI